MKVLSQLRESSEKVVSSGRSGVESVRRDRQRWALFRELGYLCYAHRSGEGDEDTSVEIDRIVVEISTIERVGADSSEAGPLATSVAAR